MLNINLEDCFFLSLDECLKEKVKNLEMKNHGTDKHFNLAIKYEAALCGLLKQDRKEIIKSFNIVELLLVNIDIIVWNYNTTALTFTPYYDKKSLMLYNLEIYKLFEFFKEPFCKILKTYPQTLLQSVKNKNIDPSFIDDIKLFPRFAMMCEEEIKLIPKMPKLNALKAQVNLWNND